MKFSFYKLDCKSVLLDKNSHQFFNYKHSKIINNFRVNLSNLNEFLRKFVDLDKMKIDETVLNNLDENTFVETEKKYNNHFRAIPLKNRKNNQLLSTKLMYN